MSIPQLLLRFLFKIKISFGLMVHKTVLGFDSHSHIVEIYQTGLVNYLMGGLRCAVNIIYM